ncbi:MAG: hypothetical protein SNJ81_00825 [Cyanobacteriota bacterium]
MSGADWVTPETRNPCAWGNLPSSAEGGALGMNPGRSPSRFPDPRPGLSISRLANQQAS